MPSDRTDELQDLLDTGNGRIVLPDGEYLVSRPLLISDGTNLICSPRTHIRLADGANCPVIKNRDKGMEMTRNVTIEGGIWDGNNLHQQRDKPKDDMVRRFSDFNNKTSLFSKKGQSYPPLMMFTYVEDFALRGVTLKDPETFGVMMTATRRFTIADVTFDYNLERENMDGIHVNGFAYDGHISNLKGATNDDLVALNADEGGFACDNCDMENITIDGIYAGRNGYTAVRLLSRTARLKSIVIRNIFGSYRTNAVSFTHWSNTHGDYGWFDGVILDGVCASSSRKSGEAHGGLIWFQPGVHHVGTVMIDNVMRIDESDAFNTVHTVDVPDDVHIDNLVIGNIRQCVPDKKESVRIGDGATIRKLDSQQSHSEATSETAQSAASEASDA